MELPQDIKLAHEIAKALDDMKSIDWHIACTKKFSESFLRDKVSYVLSRSDIDNPAGYYNHLLKIYGKHSRN